MLAPLLVSAGRLLVPARRLPYSALAIAVGSPANDFGTPGLKEHCLTIDSPVQADAFNREVRIRMLQCMTQDTELSIAIGGGGATGADLAAELAAELLQLTEDAVAYGAKGWAARAHHVELIRPDMEPADLGQLLDVFGAALGNGSLPQRRQRAHRIWDLPRGAIAAR